MRSWLSNADEVAFVWEKVFFLWGFVSSIGSYGDGLCFRLLKRAGLALATCMFVLGGALVGSITGAITGISTETGFCNGAWIGAVSGSVVALELLDSMTHEDFSPKATLLDLFLSLVNGKVFREWVSPAMLKAYLWQVSMLEDARREVADIYGISGVGHKGVSPEFINQFPVFNFHCSKTANSCSEICCPICLQDFKEGECARMLPTCTHFFHLLCIDEWVLLQASCPVCRKNIQRLE